MRLYEQLLKRGIQNANVLVSVFSDNRNMIFWDKAGIGQTLGEISTATKSTKRRKRASNRNLAIISKLRFFDKNRMSGSPMRHPLN